MSVPEKLKFCCMPILPTVFGEEMSYLEVLCKMRDSLNAMIDNMNKQDEAIADINQKVDDMDTKGYLPTAGGTLTGPLYFIDSAHVIKNEGGVLTIGGTLVDIEASGGGLSLQSSNNSVDIAAKDVEVLAGQSINLEAGTADVTITPGGEGVIRLAGNTVIEGPTITLKQEVDASAARMTVAEPTEDSNPATKKYVDDNKGTGGGSGVGFVNRVLDSSKNTQTCAAAELMPSAVLANLYVDNAGWLWLTTQFTQGRYVLENQNINVLTNAAFVGKEGKTSVKGIDIADSTSSTYEATTNVTVHGGVDVDVTAGSGTVDIEGPIVNVNGTNHVNIETGQGGDVVFTTDGVNMVNAGSVKVPTPTQDYEAATKKYVDQNAGGVGLQLLQLDGSTPYIPADAFKTSGSTTVWVNAQMDSSGDSYAVGVVTLYSGNIASNNVIINTHGSYSIAALTWNSSVGLLLQDGTIDESTYFGGVYCVVN